MNKKWEQASSTCFWNLQYQSLLIHMSCCVQQHAKRTCHPLFRHTFWLWLSGTSDWALEWNCHGKFETNCDYCCAVLDKLMLADPSVIMQRFSLLSPYYFYPRRKAMYFVLKLFIWESWLHYMYMYFYFSDWMEIMLDSLMTIGLGFVAKSNWFGCK